MTTELQVRPEPTPMALFAEAARDKDFDPEKLRVMLEMKQQWERDRAAEEFGLALTKFQAQCPIIHKSRKASFGGGAAAYTFASYDDIHREIAPLLKECGLAISFSTEQVDGQLKATCRVRHGTHFEDHTLTVPVPAMKVNDTQRFGAALSYAKRYALCAALNIVVSDEDSDGEGLVEVISEEQVIQLTELIEATNTDLKRFLKWAAIGSLKEMSRDFYPAAINELKRKERSR